MTVPGLSWFLPQSAAARRWSPLLVLVWSSLGACAQSLPWLQIEPTPFGTVLVHWPVGDGLFRLQERSEVDSPDGWLPTRQEPEMVSGVYRLELEPAERAQFFRLQPVSQPEPGLVPRPETLAPPPPIHLQASFAESTAFLHRGATPVQIGVIPGTILSQRASVLRGQVKKRDGSPLAGVHVRVLNHPEFGHTYTRADGMFDLGVNGGPLYTIDFQTRGYCPAQRQVEAPVQNYRCLEDVILVAMDPVATPVAFGTNAPQQVARSSVQTDKAGSRSATVLFPAGTCATLEFPDGTQQDCSVLTIRATEFTVGPGGPQAMPGPLPPTSAYTYAVELSGDEAAAMGANTIRFNQRVHVYVDNFLAMPTGALMPSAYYDRQRAAWVPQENGVVIEVLGVVDGLARVDVNGDGEEESASDLETLAFTRSELQHLAARYPGGTTLWRMPATHFTAMDYNCPENPMDRRKPNKPGDRGKGNDCDNAGGGGEVNLYSQVFKETLPLVGVPMDLHYSSARVPGYRVDAELRLPMTGDTLPEDLIKVRVDMDVAGRLGEFEFPAQTNLVGRFAWDGFDAYGRLLNESHRAYFTQYYFYPRIYGGHERPDQIVDISAFAPLFGNYGSFSSTIAHSEVGQAVALKFDRVLTIPDHRQAGLGGWSVTPHHRYDPIGKILYLGDGTVQRPESLANGVFVEELDATFDARNVAAASDGSLFITQRGGRVYRRDTSGILTPLTAGLGPDGIDYPDTVVIRFYGDFQEADGKPASQVRLEQTPWHDIAVGPDDSLYLRTFWSIVRITPDGIFRVMIGRTGSETFPSDGSVARDPGVATSAIANGFVAVGTDHTVYYNDEWTIDGQRRDYVRKISPDGRISTLIGPAGRADEFTEGPAIGIRTAPITGLAVAPDGSVYVAGGPGMVRISPGGIAAQVMNGAAVSGENHPLRQAGSEGQLAVSSTPNRFNATYVNLLTVGADGLPYFYFPQGPGFIWKIDSDGRFQRVAGNWSGPFEGGSNPLAVQIGDVRDFTIDRGGAVTLLSLPPGSLGSGRGSLRRIGPSFPGFDAAELQVAARDGGELYVFSRNGLHLRTLDTLTGATNWQFAYDSRNLLVEIRDVNHLSTRVERNAVGNPSALVGPYGHRSVLALDAQGYLSEVTDPAGASTRLGYGTAGLLTSIQGPRGPVFRVAYDDQGRARQMAAPNGGALSVAHAHLGGTDYSTTAVDATGNRTFREVRLDPDGSSVLRLTHADGGVSSEVRTATGVLMVTNRNGTVTRLRTVADPRFRGQTAVLGEMAVEFPGGLRSVATMTRIAGLREPGQPLSLTSLNVTVSVNGQTYRDDYDAASRQLTSTTPEGRVILAEYDSAGRLLLEQAGAEAPSRFLYDGQGRLMEATEEAVGDVRTRRYQYNLQGLVERVTDPLGRTLEFEYDALERPVRVTLPDRGEVALEYDSEGSVTGITPPGRPRHEFQYDEVGSLLRYTPPRIATEDTWSYAYDLERNLTNITVPEGPGWSMIRGVEGRPERLTLGAGSEFIYEYQPDTGQLSKVRSNAGEEIAFSYQGSLPVQTRWSGVVTGSVHLEFNENLQLAAHRVNDQRTAYVYDRDGLLVQAGDLSLTRSSASGRVMTNRVGVVVETFAFDDQGKLTNNVVSLSGIEFSRVALGYDRLNRVTHRVETLGASTRERQYAYDVGGLLSEVRLGGAVVATYTYDSNGNRVGRNSETATYDVQDRVIAQGGVAFGWSRNGHRVSRVAGAETVNYTYDLNGALTSVALPANRIDYLIDPLGRRVGRKVNGTLDRGWLWLDQQIVAEVGTDSAVTKRFVYSGESGAPVLMHAGPDTFYLLNDERGSVRRVVNVADGEVVQALEYDEFGRVLSDTNPGFQPFGFAGGLYDPATGLVRIGARDYDAETGQWTARDPIGFAGGQLSLYAYVRNDPVNFVDPSGTGPFLGFLDRNRQRAIDAAFDTSPGNNQRFEKALDRYDQSVKAAVLTGQVLVTTGALLNSIAPGPRGPRGPRTGLGRTGFARAAPRTGAAAVTRSATSTRFSQATVQWARTGASSTRSLAQSQGRNFGNFVEQSTERSLSVLKDLLDFL